MLSKERSFRIMNLINQQGFVTVSELMESLQASRSSIMRDLIQLENEGLIQRERGGASKLNTSTMLLSINEAAVFDKTNINATTKTKLCKEAMKVIKEGECIFLDSGTTVVDIPKYIFNKKVTIVTPSVHLVKNLPDNYDGYVHLLGGEYDKKYDMVLGNIALDTIRELNFDHAFFSTSGVSLDSGEIYVSNYANGVLKKTVMKRTTNNYLLVDTSKFTIKSIATWATLDQFTTVYLNDKYEEKYQLPDNFVIVK